MLSDEIIMFKLITIETTDSRKAVVKNKGELLKWCNCLFDLWLVQYDPKIKRTVIMRRLSRTWSRSHDQDGHMVKTLRKSFTLEPVTDFNET